ncbi:MAG TPA: ABC transporter ATP-binding protein [Bacteroidales bacterium]|nr:ABC transporter ATP-binding protein [Bacteroidales bacterium]
MIIAENIVKRYSTTTALNRVSFRIDRGELFGFIGPDGAGKTTLFRILTTLLIPDEGKARVMGYDTVSEFRKLRSHIGYMPGRFSLYHDLTVEENLNFYATVFGTTVKENYHLIRDVYSHIEPFRKRQAGKLSGGMKQKLALCCALIHAPSLIVLDEPTTGVDAVSRAEFWAMLKNILKEGITIIVSTPYMDEAMRCDRVALIQSGKILRTDDPEKLINSFSTKLFSVTASERFNLLQKLRMRQTVSSVNVFGDSVHISFKNNIIDPDLHKYLTDSGFGDAIIEETRPGIEDIFLQLLTMGDDE